MRLVLPLLGTLLLAAIAVGSVWFAVDADIPSLEGTVVTPAVLTPVETSEPKAVSLLPPRRPDIFYQAITDRPLFALSRRPVILVEDVVDVNPEPEIEVEEPKLVDEPQDIPEPDLVLLGVLTGGAKNSALISVNGEDPKWVREGQMVASWTLTEIKTDNIKLIESDRALSVELYRK